jgi:hypothetical protein
MAKCRACKAEIMWMTTTNGKKIPVDIETVGDIGATVFDPDTMVSHFATCPDAEKFRKRR